MVFNKFYYLLAELLSRISYDCGSDDKKNLESLQRQIQDRITFLDERNLDSYNDPQLLEYYELYSQIEKCIFDDHSEQYVLIAAIVSILLLLVYFRWRMIKKSDSKRY